MFIVPGVIVYDGEKESYNVLGSLGSGAFGYVYKIKRESDNSTFAIKTLPTDYINKETLSSFVNEANLAVKVRHRNVIEYIYFHDGSLFPDLPPYMIMEYADQGTLREVIENQKAKGEFFSNDELKDYFTQLIDGMEAISCHLIHRDIKSDNILMKDNLLKISDFGLSKIIEQKTRTSTFKGFGHIMYMAPEGWRYENNTIQMDIYSMGIVFYELATLLHPYERLNLNDVEKWRKAHLFINPEKPNALNEDVSTTISQLILKMLEKGVTERFKSWSEIREALAKDDIPPTVHTPLIENFLKKRLEKDIELKEKRLEREKRQKEIQEFKNIVKYQFEKSILTPIQEFIDEFNLRSQIDSIQISHKLSPMGFYIHLTSSSRIDIQIKALIDEDFYRKREFNRFGRTIIQTELERPLYNNKRIMGWGYAKGLDSKGFNIILVERENEIYGDWYILMNINTPTIGKKRYPEPFPLGFEEIEERIKNLRVLDIYQTEVKPLDVKYLIELIEQYI